MNLRLLVLCLPSLLVAERALACINGQELERKPPDTLLAQARRAYQAGRFTEAASKSALALSAPGSEAERRSLWRTHGLSCLKIGNLERALESLSSLAQTTKEPFVHVKLAEAQLRAAAKENRVDATALASLEAYAKRELVADADALTALARARLDSGDSAGAKAACQRSLAIEPSHAEAKALRSTLAGASDAAPGLARAGH